MKAKKQCINICLYMKITLKPWNLPSAALLRPKVHLIDAYILNHDLEPRDYTPQL